MLTKTQLSDGSWTLRTNDLAGRVTDYQSTEANGTVLQHSVRTWDKDNRMLQEHDQLLNKGSRYELMADGTVSAIQTYGEETTLRTTYQYQLWDSAKQSSVTIQAKNATVDSWHQVWQPGFSQFGYDVNGHSSYARDESGNRSFRYWTDADGQVLKRDELIGGSFDPATGVVNGASKNRSHNYYYFDGHRVGDVGNDSVERIDYAQELANVRQGGSERSYQKFTPSNAADFDQSYQPINGEYPGGAPSVYTVRTGDTLAGVARALWGDAGLWYLLADANGLLGVQPGDALTANSTLVVPNKVANIHNTSATFKPYNPGKALGDTSPTLPKAPTPPPPPPSDSGGCGGMGSVIMIVVAIVATVFTAGAAALAMGAAGTAGMGAMAAGMAVMTGAAGLSVAAVGAAAIGAAVGSIVSQGVGIAIGAQDEFSWKQVGLSAVAGGLSSGAGSVLSGSTTMGTFGALGTPVRTMVQAGIANTMSQGLMTASGLQHSFDWRGVAVSVAAAGVGYAVGQVANMAMDYNPQPNGQGFDWGKQFASNTVSGIAAGATYAGLHGDNISVGQLVAGAAVYGAASASVTEQQLLIAQKQNGELDFQRDVANRRMSNPLSQVRNVAESNPNVQLINDVFADAGSWSRNRDRSSDILLAATEIFAGVNSTAINQPTPVGIDEAGRPQFLQPTINVSSSQSEEISDWKNNITGWLDAKGSELKAMVTGDGSPIDNIVAAGKWSVNSMTSAVNLVAAGSYYAQLEKAGIDSDAFPLSQIPEWKYSNARQAGTGLALDVASLMTGVVGLGRVALKDSVFVFRPPQYARLNIGINVSDSVVRIETVTDKMRAVYKDMGYLSPRNNKITMASIGDVIAVDHILPSTEIIRMRGFNTLTKEQMTNILQDRIGLGNLQPLPQSLNASKGAKVGDWKSFKNKELDVEYRQNLSALQDRLRSQIQRQIDLYNRINYQGTR
ncbi:LysM peptidoglycan-binding domain-containing protein [Herbaspirillum autotrophicum]|uniref:LysM peptidoglycan-binding domain-containing protein n=1 Tax=Herbaspirillum autotrophicum TaxID=180195 RepID=UPI00067B2187|nr:LysM peptidoglycan-binding domain-containing protein [Herbaspirillum autotrophicum]